MSHPFEELRPEYERLLAAERVLPARQKSIDAAARRLTSPTYLARYMAVQEATGVPAALIAALDERESGADPSCGLGQGDPWNRVSTHVPRGHGPFPSWVAAAIHYVRYDRLDDASANWTMPYCCWKGEAWNGFGPRAHGIRTGYLWAGTNQYVRGKYIADGKWSASTVDQQNGIVPIMKAMMVLRPSLVIPGLEIVAAPSIVPVQAVPEWLSNAVKVQQWLNLLGARPQLLEDGSYGHLTRAAVRAFQASHGLKTDGLAGPKTTAALEEEIDARHAESEVDDD